MCLSSTKLIFCKCPDVLEGKRLTWVLKRRGIESKPNINIIGSFAPPPSILIENYDPIDILLILERDSPFDFPFQPRQGDIFYFSVDGVASGEYSYRYSRGSWRFLNSNGPEFYEMLRISQGTVHQIEVNENNELDFDSNHY